MGLPTTYSTEYVTTRSESPEFPVKAKLYVSQDTKRRLTRVDVANYNLDTYVIQGDDDSVTVYQAIDFHTRVTCYHSVAPYSDPYPTRDSCGLPVSKGIQKINGQQVEEWELSCSVEGVEIQLNEYWTTGDAPVPVRFVSLVDGESITTDFSNFVPTVDESLFTVPERCLTSKEVPPVGGHTTPEGQRVVKRHPARLFS